MSVNSSFSVSLLPPLLSNSSLHPLNFRCSSSAVGSLMLTAFTILNFLLVVPLSIFVLYLGLQRWRRQRFVCTATMTSHSDLFTYHMIAMELICFLGNIFFCCGIYMNLLEMMTVGFYAFSIILPGQILFHCLTCVERYLAVVHPITYLGLRRAGGVRLRNISIGCVWLLCFGWVGLTALYIPTLPTIPFFCFFIFFLFVISFCSLSVLRALIRPGPGEMGGNRERVDQSKKRAFLTITAILGVLLLKFVGLLIGVGMHTLALKGGDGCVALVSGFWVCLPSSLVLPLLFLHRAGKLLCCMHNVESG